MNELCSEDLSVRDMTRTYSQMHCADKYSEHSSIIEGQFGQMVECSFKD